MPMTVLMTVPTSRPTAGPTTDPLKRLPHGQAQSLPKGRVGALLSLAATLLLSACPGPSAETVTDTLTSESEATEASGTFLLLPEASPVEECNPGAQDCPDGEHCSPYVRDPGECCVDSTHCVPLLGDKSTGEPCSRGVDNDDCATGLFCMTNASGELGPGHCVELCDPGVSGTCAQGSRCIPFDDGFLPLCVTPCDPLAPACEEGQGCYLLVAEEAFVCLNSATDAGADNAACTTLQDCAPGLVCFDGGAQASCSSDQCCTPICDLGGGGAECKNILEGCHTPFVVGQMPADSDVGVCAESTARQQDPHTQLHRR